MILVTTNFKVKYTYWYKSKKMSYKLFFQTFIFSYLLVTTSCEIFETDKKEEVYQNTIYANVFLQNEEEGYTQELLAINYDNPNQFQILANAGQYFSSIRVSPNSNMLIYGDAKHTGNVPQFVKYDLNSNQRTLLHIQNFNIPLFGEGSVGVVWNKESTGFYYTNEQSGFDPTNATLFYDIENERGELVKVVSEKSIIPIGLLGSDTLIVSSNEFDTLAHYTMTLSGEYIKRIDNPCLEYINTNGLIKRGVLHKAWNDSLKLFTGYYINESSFEGFKIIVTDMNGNVCNEFTEGLYYNHSPRWLKTGEIIFTERRGFSEISNTQLKLLDPITGKVTPFFGVEQFPEAIGVGTADQ